MQVWYDPTSNNQVMAIYSGDAKSRVWADRGFIAVTVSDPELCRQIDRDCQVTLERGEVTSVTPARNPVQPVPSPVEIERAGLTAKLADDTITDAEIRRLLRLERGL